jgi:hypothetical protein
MKRILVAAAAVMPLLANPAAADHSRLHTYLCTNRTGAPNCLPTHEGPVPASEPAMPERAATEQATYQTAWERAMAVWHPALYEKHGARWRGAALLDACGEGIPEAVGLDEVLTDDIFALLPDTTKDPDPVGMGFRVLLATNAITAGYIMGYGEAFRLMIQSGLVDRDLVCATGVAF